MASATALHTPIRGSSPDSGTGTPAATSGSIIARIAVTGTGTTTTGTVIATSTVVADTRENVAVM
jgi:hypothetical protein